MNIKFRKALSVVLMMSLLGCGSSGESEKQPAKEAEIKEVEITLDNWQDYFELYNELQTEIAAGNEFLERDQGKEYYSGYPLMIKIKDEYKLAEDKESSLDFQISAVYEFHKLKIENGSIIVGDPVTNEDCMNSETALGVWSQEDIEINNEIMQENHPNWKCWLDENGVYYQSDIIGFGPCHNYDLINGKVLGDNGIVYKRTNGKQRISEEPFALLIYNIEMKEINGTIYIYE